MENKEVEVLTINGRDLMVIDEDNEVIYTTNIDDNKDIAILRKIENSDDIYELDEIERMPYLKMFIKKYGNLIQNDEKENNNG